MDPNAVSYEEGDAPSRAKTEGPDEVAPHAGSGRWVESSWDLHRGLTVREGLPPDAGLDEWLEALLRG